MKTLKSIISITAAFVVICLAVSVQAETVPVAAARQDTSKMAKMDHAKMSKKENKRMSKMAPGKSGKMNNGKMTKKDTSGKM